MIRNQEDCLKAISILEPNLVVGKKAGEFAIWCRAVRAWTSGHGNRNGVVAACAEDLIAHRCPEFAPSLAQVDISDEHLRAFFAGFATAEAHFGASRDGHPSFTVNMRGDDSALLGLFHGRFRLGRLVAVPPRGPSRAALSWRVSRLVELRSLVGLLNKHPPRGRVARIYDAWRALVLLEERTAARRELAERSGGGAPTSPGSAKSSRTRQRFGAHATLLRSVRGPRRLADLTPQPGMPRGAVSPLRERQPATPSSRPSGRGRRPLLRRASVPMAAGRRRSSSGRLAAVPWRAGSGWRASGQSSSKVSERACARSVAYRARPTSSNGETGAPPRCRAT
jgi:hypothetical protein